MKILKKYAGVIIGAIYALLIRLVFNIDSFGYLFSLFSITFIWVTPIIIGLIPLFFASKEQLKDWRYRVSSPVLTVVVFFIICFLSRIEDMMCIIILLVPYMLAALTVGFLAGEIILRIKNKKKTLYTFILIPFIVSPIEQQFQSPVNSYLVSNTVIIEAKPDSIWNNIIRVRQIDESEYNKGFFNYAGIPKPLYAELDKDSIGATRIGHFEGGLKFIEKVTKWNKNKEIAFDITVIPSTIRETVFDQHILKGNHFKFLNAEYQLTELPGGHIQLTLSSSYELNSNVNSYGAFCGNKLLTDFQERLLSVIKNRCEHN